MASTRTVLHATSRFYQRISADIILFAAFLALGWFLVHFLVNSNYARQLFDQTVNPLIRCRMTWDHITWGPLPWQVRVVGYSIIDERDEPVITADAVRADADLLAVLHGEVRVGGITIRHPRVRIWPVMITDDFGQLDTATNIEICFQSPTPSVNDGNPGVTPTLDFTVDALEQPEFELDYEGVWLHVDGGEVRDAHFSLKDGGAGPPIIRMSAAVVDIDAFEIRLQRGEGPIRARDRVGDGLIAWQAQNLRVRNYRSNAQQFNVQSAKVPLGDDTLRLNSFSIDVTRPDLPALRGRFRADLEDVGVYLGAFGVAGVEGPVQLDLQGTGELDSFEGTFALEGPGLQVDTLRVGSWRVAGAVADNRIRLEAIEAAVLGGHLSAEGLFDAPAGVLWAEARLEDVLPQALPVGLSPEVATLVGGWLNGHVGIRGRGLYGEDRVVSADVRLTLDRMHGPMGPPTGPKTGALPRVLLPQRTRLNAAATLIGDALEVHTLDVDAGAERLRLAGEVDLAGLAVTLAGTLQAREVGPYAAAFGVPIGGAVRSRFQVTGTLADPAVEFTVNGTGVRYPGAPVADVDVTGRYADGKLVLKTAELRTGAGDATLSGEIDLRSPGVPLRLHARTARVDLARLGLHPDLRGRAAADVTVAGTPRAPRVTLDARVEAPAWAGLGVESIAVKGAWDGVHLDLAHLRVADEGRDVITAQGEVDLAEERYRGEVKIDRVPLQRINDVAGTALPLQGTVSVDLAGNAYFDEPRGSGTLELAGVEYGAYALGDGVLMIDARGDRVELIGELFDLVQVDAVLPTQPGPEPARVTLDFTRVDLEKRLPTLAAVGVAARITGEVVATGDLFAPSLDAVSLRLDEVIARYQDLPLVTQNPVRARFADARLHIDQLDLRVASQVLRLRGTVTPLLGETPDAALDLEIGGELDLALLARLLEAQFTSARGRADLALKVEGTVSDPHPTGYIRLAKAVFSPRATLVGRDLELVEPALLEISSDYGPRLSADDVGNFLITLSEKPFRVPGTPPRRNRIEIQRDDGRLYVSTLSLHFRRFAAQDLLLVADGTNVAINVPETLRAVVNLHDLEFAMNELSAPLKTVLRIGGDVEVLRGTYSKNHLASAEVNQGMRDQFGGRARTAELDVFDQSPILKRLFLDVSLHGDSDIYVRNQVAVVLDLDLEVRLDFRQVKGFIYDGPEIAAEDKLKIEGIVTVQPDNSRILYSGREFEVLDGQVTLREDEFLQAELRARRVFQVRVDGGGTVISAVGGSAVETREEIVDLSFTVRIPTRDSEPQYTFNLESTSGASRLEVATLVLTGQYPSNLSAAAAAQPALQAALGPLLGLVERPLEDTLDLELTLTPVSSGALVIDADKRLSRRLRLYSRTPFGEAETTAQQTFGLEYRLNNSLYGDLNNERVGSLNSTTGQLRLRVFLD